MTVSSVQGDSTTAEAYRRALEGRLAQAVITDPPYCLLTRRRKGGDEREKKDRKVERGPLRRFENVREYRDFTRSWLRLALDPKHTSPEATLVVWTNLLGREPITSIANELGWSTRLGEFVWGKRTREGNSGEELLRVVETALVLSKAAPRPLEVGAPAVPWSVVAGYDDDAEAEQWGNHPSHKPFGVVEPLLRTWSRPGDLVLDPFAGSGSIPAAALRLGRAVACIELEADWASRVSARLSQGPARYGPK